MSEEQLSVFSAVFHADPGLLDKVNVAADLDAALAITDESGLAVSAEDWCTYQSSQDSINSENLAAINGGKGPICLSREQAFELLGQS